MSRNAYIFGDYSFERVISIRYNTTYRGIKQFKETKIKINRDDLLKRTKYFLLWRISVIEEKKVKYKNKSSLGGFEPPTFRLTAERASRLRHRDFIIV